ncbi:DUF3073 domain-containing protein [Brachybacterium huguangmaarense]|uniref:DUF3073 domain-containing protein n=1 Tax=Brachybacterium huguangmaarense TaxID=1652028 RepID=A0ABY6G1J3_9MICO|nr:DUF3073 domain-containing protein [Brachybacterium huguangmaarense]UYG17077.1 DUF3073 domain-containing protein [Brachybacterium huguangmaarense]
MGRGRQKAKQTKVARDLKYYSPPTDLSALQRELQSSSANDEYDDAEDFDDEVEESDDDTDDWAPSPASRRR